MYTLIINNGELQCHIKSFTEGLELKELPDKIEKRYVVEMTKEQKKVYKTYIDDIKNKMKEKRLEKEINLTPDGVSLKII